MFLVSCICIDNHTNGMENPSSNKFYFDRLPEGFKDGFIERLAACSAQKNVLMEVNKLFHDLCSKENADHLLTYDLLTLSDQDKQYFMNQYAYKGDTYLNIVINLLDINANPNESDFFSVTPLMCVTESPNGKEMRNVLIAHGMDQNLPSKLEMSPLHKAVYFREIDTIKSLINAQTDVNSQDMPFKNTPLILASFYGYADVAQLLFEYGAKVNVTNDKGFTPLHRACYSGHLNIVEWLLNCGADINAQDQIKGYTPAFHAYIKNNFVIVEFLINNNANIAVPNKNGYTPLHEICRLGDTDAIDFLINHGADVNAKDSKDGNTPLHIACSKGKLESVKLLIKQHNADINSTNNYGRTPLQLACSKKGPLNLIEFLINHGAIIDLTDNDGYTPLHWACVYGYLDIVEVLLKHNADVNLINKHDATPLQIAQGLYEVGHGLSFKAIIDLLNECQKK